MINHPATVIVHTPTGTTAACASHAAKIARLMSFMGAHTNEMPAPEGAQCANCINEEKKKC